MVCKISRFSGARKFLLLKLTTQAFDNTLDSNNLTRSDPQRKKQTALVCNVASLWL